MPEQKPVTYLTATGEEVTPDGHKVGSPEAKVAAAQPAAEYARATPAAGQQAAASEFATEPHAGHAGPVASADYGEQIAASIEAPLPDEAAQQAAEEGEQMVQAMAEAEAPKPVAKVASKTAKK